MSPCFIRKVQNGVLSPVEYEADSLATAAEFEPVGIYTVTNTYNHDQVLKLDAHLTRMKDSARRSGMDIQLDKKALRKALREVIEASEFEDVRFRITIPASAPDTWIMSVEPFQPPSPSVYSDGVKVVTLTETARHNPAAKTTDWMKDRRAVETQLGKDIYTALLVSPEGNILEGLSSNFYAIINDQLFTAGEGVLAGIAQQIVFEVATNIIPVIKTAPHIDQCSIMQEAFLTSASRGIMPVVQIDEVVLGDSTPGPKTKALWQAYQAWVKTHLEPI